MIAHRGHIILEYVDERSFTVGRLVRRKELRHRKMGSQAKGGKKREKKELSNPASHHLLKGFDTNCIRDMHQPENRVSPIHPANNPTAPSTTHTHFKITPFGPK